MTVFLGHGVSWVIATTYYGLKGEVYTTPQDGLLSFAILTFLVRATSQGRSPACVRVNNTKDAIMAG